MAKPTSASYESAEAKKGKYFAPKLKMPPRIHGPNFLYQVAWSALDRLPFELRKKFIEGMPKVELHSHVGGSVLAKYAFEKLAEYDEEEVCEIMVFKRKRGKGETPEDDEQPEDNEEIISEMIEENGERIKREFIKRKFYSVEELDQYLRKEVRTLEDYLVKYNATREIFNDLENIPDIMWSVINRYHAENTIVLELRTALKTLDKNSGIKNTANHDPDAEMERYLSVITEAREKYGMVINLILCIRRGNTDDYVEFAEKTVDMAIKYKDKGVVGVDIVGAENGQMAKRLLKPIRRAIQNGLKVTIHAGEGAHQGSGLQALRMGARRIGHFTSLEPEGQAFDHVRKYGTPIECCVLSNGQCQAKVATAPRKTEPLQDTREHPIRWQYDLGLNVTVNTDNRVISNTRLTKELLYLHEELNFRVVDLIEMTRSGFLSSFSTEEEKINAVDKLYEYIEEFWDEHCAAA